MVDEHGQTPEKAPLVFVDVETTGFSQWKHEIIELGVALFDASTFAVREQRSCKVQFSGVIADDVRAINGYDPEKWRDAIPLNEALTMVFPLLEGARWVGSNPTFDRDFMRVAANKCNLKMPKLARRRLVDINSMAEPWIADRDADGGIDNLLDLFGLPPRGKPHNALKDAMIAAEIYQRIMWMHRHAHQFWRDG